MDSIEVGESVLPFLTIRERQQLRIVCRRWYFTAPWLQYADLSLSPGKKSPFSLHSRRFQHTWTQFMRARCNTLLDSLKRHLPPPSKEETYVLKMGLCKSTNTGVRPPFDNASARSGYTFSKMNRCGNFPNVLLTREMSEVRAKLLNSGTKELCVALYGGGPGYDSIGLVFLREFVRMNDLKIHTNVYDNEPGWARAVMGVDVSLRDLGYTKASWSFKLCDITEDISVAINGEADADIASTDLFVFAFVCVENFCLLRDSKFSFLRSLFGRCRVGSTFVFTDSTHRLWPIVWDVAMESATFRIWTPHARGCHYALILEKIPHDDDPSGYPYYSDAMESLAAFSRHHSSQLRSIEGE